YTPATTVFFTLSLHDALPISLHFDLSVIGSEFLDLAVSHEIHAAISDVSNPDFLTAENAGRQCRPHAALLGFDAEVVDVEVGFLDRKSTRLNSSHLGISYAVF